MFSIFGKCGLFFYKMGIEFLKAKNGEETCRFEKFQLHSSYNPSREAESFVNNEKCNFNPKLVVVCEPCLSYCVEPLRIRFPKATVVCVRYCKDFAEYDKLWDKVFYLDSNCELSQDLFNNFGEEAISQGLFLNWNPAATAFPDMNDKCWKEIVKAVKQATSVLQTRTYFAKRWAKNAIRFCLFTKNLANVEKSHFPIVICASGPSLKSSIPFIKKNRDKMFLIAVSSALSVLHSKGIESDLCLSTDGGYWAKIHLGHCLKNSKTVLALSGESAVYSSSLLEHPVVPLFYNDGISQDILEHCHYKGLVARRNGTVSGTAVELALSLTDTKVYTVGLDLSETKGFVHTQPNSLEMMNCVKDNRLSTLETRITPSNFVSPSIEIYKNWFMNQNFNSRVFRLSDNYKFSNNLNDVKDVNWDFFEKDIKTLENTNLSKQKVSFYKQDFNLTERKELLKKIILENKDNLNWKKEAVIVQLLAYEKSVGFENEKEKLETLNSDMEDFVQSLLSCVNLGE